MKTRFTIEAEPWMQHGLCRGKPTEWWFPSPDSHSPHQWDKARQICQDCPVREDCLQYALSTHSRYGMWGGSTPAERVDQYTLRTHGSRGAYHYHLRLGEEPCDPCREANNLYKAHWRRWAPA